MFSVVKLVFIYAYIYIYIYILSITHVLLLVRKRGIQINHHNIARSATRRLPLFSQSAPKSGARVCAASGMEGFPPLRLFQAAGALAHKSYP